MRNSLFVLQIDWAESTMGPTFLTEFLSPIFRVFVPNTGLNDLKKLLIWVHWSCMQGTQRTWQEHHRIRVILLKQLLLPRGDGTHLASAARYVLLQSRQTCRAFHSWQGQVPENSGPHISLYTRLKPSGRCTLAWKTYFFSHFSIFSSSVKKKRRRLVEKKCSKQ